MVVNQRKITSSTKREHENNICFFFFDVFKKAPFTIFGLTSKANCNHLLCKHNIQTCHIEPAVKKAEYFEAIARHLIAIRHMLLYINIFSIIYLKALNYQLLWILTKIYCITQHISYSILARKKTIKSFNINAFFMFEHKLSSEVMHRQIFTILKKSLCGE